MCLSKSRRAGAYKTAPLFSLAPHFRQSFSLLSTVTCRNFDAQLDVARRCYARRPARLLLLVVLLLAPAHLATYLAMWTCICLPTIPTFHRIQQFHHCDACDVCYRMRIKFSDILLGALCVCALHVRPRSRIISRLSIS